MERRASVNVLALATLFAASGTLHFVVPRHFESIVPHRLPARRTLVYASGAAELACAAGLVVPRTRRTAGLASTAVLVAVFPANVQMAADVCRSSGGPLAKVLVLLRLPLQLPMTRTAWRAWRT
ncbi:MAG: DoxX family protein [Nocardioidaceae bacterium]|nr:DoxX family protein [Nocardioidaceae bacterium]